jgi:hypothetical protein
MLSPLPIPDGKVFLILAEHSFEALQASRGDPGARDLIQKVRAIPFRTAISI